MSIGMRSSGHFRYIKVRYTVKHETRTYPAKLISFELWLTAAETPFVNEVRKLLLHQLVDLRHRLVQPLFRGAGDVQVERGVLERSLVRRPQRGRSPPTAAVAMLLSG